MTVRKLVVGMIGVSAFLLSGGPSATSAQEATERYIPIGQSPGVSGKQTVIGKLAEVNTRDQTVTIVGPSGTSRVKVTPRTKIWLDRSQLGQTNLKGTIADLRQGATVEMKPEGQQRGASDGSCEWIKVQVAAQK